MPKIDKVRLVMTQLPPFAEFHFCKVHQGNALHNSQDNVSDTKPHPSPPPNATLYDHVMPCAFLPPMKESTMSSMCSMSGNSKAFFVEILFSFTCRSPPEAMYTTRYLCPTRAVKKPLTYPEILELGSLDWIRDTSVERWGQGFTNLNFIVIRYKLSYKYTYVRTYKWEFRGNMSSLHQINIGTLSLKKVLVDQLIKLLSGFQHDQKSEIL